MRSWPKADLSGVLVTLGCFAAGGFVPMTAAGGGVPVNVRYDYRGKAQVPSDAEVFCLDVQKGPAGTKMSADEIRSVCAKAASMKGFNVKGTGAGCHKISLVLSVRETPDVFEKTMRFQFYAPASADATTPSLTAVSAFNSAHEEFTEASVAAGCRAVFNEFPERSDAVDVVAGTDVEDIVKGNGYYGLGQLMLNGFSAGPGYFHRPDLAFEARYESLRDSLNMDAQSAQKISVIARYFPSRQSYLTMGLGMQQVSFSDGLVYKWEKIITDEMTKSNIIKGSMATAGAEASLGFYMQGRSLQAGPILGWDIFGFYQPLWIVSDKITIENPSDAKIRDKVSAKVRGQGTFYVMRLNLGYAF